MDEEITLSPLQAELFKELTDLLKLSRRRGAEGKPPFKSLKKCLEAVDPDDKLMSEFASLVDAEAFDWWRQGRESVKNSVNNSDNRD